MCTTVEQVFEQVKNPDERVFEWWDGLDTTTEGTRRSALRTSEGRLDRRYRTGEGTVAAAAAYGQERTSARARLSTNGSACL